MAGPGCLWKLIFIWSKNNPWLRFWNSNCKAEQFNHFRQHKNQDNHWQNRKQAWKRQIGHYPKWHCRAGKCQIQGQGHNQISWKPWKLRALGSKKHLVLRPSRHRQNHACQGTVQWAWGSTVSGEGNLINRRACWRCLIQNSWPL